MSEGNISLEQRLAELRSMRLEIAALEAQPEDATNPTTPPASSAAPGCGRSGYQNVPDTIATKSARS